LALSNALSKGNVPLVGIDGLGASASFGLQYYWFCHISANTDSSAINKSRERLNDEKRSQGDKMPDEITLYRTNYPLEEAVAAAAKEMPDLKAYVELDIIGLCYVPLSNWSKNINVPGTWYIGKNSARITGGEEGINDKVVGLYIESKDEHEQVMMRNGMPIYRKLGILVSEEYVPNEKRLMVRNEKNNKGTYFQPLEAKAYFEYSALIEAMGMKKV
jgi:hypothetical protein